MAKPWIGIPTRFNDSGQTTGKIRQYLEPVLWAGGLPVMIPTFVPLAEALEYFKSRLTQAPRDSRHGLSLVQTHCTTVETQRRAFEALAFKLELLWVMIDSIHHAYMEP